MKHKLFLVVVLALTSLYIPLSVFSTQIISDVHTIIISGQVTSIDYGSPIANNTVYIKSIETNTGIRNYEKEVLTDSEGYFYDTVTTSSCYGSFNISTYDQNGKVYDTVLHYRHIEKFQNILIANFEIYYTSTTRTQARFKTYQRINGDKLTYKFVDVTDSENIIKRLWEFGDGTSSTEESPEHTYPDYGLYKINLHIVISEGGQTITIDASKQVYSSDFDFYHMGGHAFSNHFPIDKGAAYLYQIDRNDKYTALDTSYFDTLGYYYFYQVPQGNYVVKIEPRRESQYYSILLPTYYGDKYFWQDAEIINLAATSWEYDVQLDIADGIITGNGLIGGNVQYINNFKDLALDDYAEGVQIYLFDESENMLSYRYSGTRGDFDFSSLNLGSYYIYPEITGIVAEKELVELTPSIPVVNNIEINIDLNNASSVNQEIDNETLLINAPYPNPAKEVVIVEINDNSDNLSFKVFCINGQQVFDLNDFNKSEQTVSFKVNDLENGTYILHAENENSSTNYLFVVAK